MSLDKEKIWVVGSDLSSFAKKLSIPDSIDLVLTDSCEEVFSQVDEKEKISFIAKIEDKKKLEKFFGKRIITRILYTGPLDTNTFQYHLSTALEHLAVTRSIEELESSILKEKVQSNRGKLIFLEKIILKLLNARTTIAIEKVLLLGCKNIVPVKKLLLQVDPPHISKSELKEFHFALPIQTEVKLLAHIYVCFSTLDSKQIENYISRISDVFLMLADIIGIILQKNFFLENIKKTNMIWKTSFEAVEDPMVILKKDLSVAMANQAYLKIAKKKRLIFPRKEIMPYLNYPGSEWEYSIGSNYYRVYLDKSTPDSINQNYILRLHDITNEKKLRERMLANQQVADLGILISSVAHDINNPIAGILAYTQILLKKYSSDVQLSNNIKSIQEAAERCKKITQTMLFLVRKPEGEKNIISLRECIQDVLSLLDPEAKRLEVKIDFKFPDTAEDKIQANKSQILHLFFHLLQARLNSVATYFHEIKHTKIRFSLSLERHNNTIYVFIKDNAVGALELEDSSVAYNVVKILLESLGGKITTKKTNVSYTQKLVFQSI